MLHTCGLTARKRNPTTLAAESSPKEKIMETMTIRKVKRRWVEGSISP